MPRDDDFDDDDRPRRRRPRDDDEVEPDDRPARARRRAADDDNDDGGPRRPPKKKNTGLLIGVLVGVFVVCCGGGGVGAYWLFSRTKEAVNKAVEGIQDTAESGNSRANMIQIGLALHNHNDNKGVLPNNSYDDQFKRGAKPTFRPLLSWRVHLLPLLNEEGLYRRFKLDEPWDSANNRPLLSQMPAVYGTPEARKKAGEGKTFYRGFSHPGALFEKPRGPGPGQPAIQLSIPASFPDGLANTLAIVEAGEAVEWTKAEDLDWSPGRPRPALGGMSPNLPYCNVLMMDGAVRHLRKDVPEETLRRLITRNDGLIIPQDWEYR
jgi:Protein of unknown function (DUF1559)